MGRHWFSKWFHLGEAASDGWNSPCECGSYQDRPHQIGQIGSWPPSHTPPPHLRVFLWNHFWQESHKGGRAGPLAPSPARSGRRTDLEVRAVLHHFKIPLPAYTALYAQTASLLFSSLLSRSLSPSFFTLLCTRVPRTATSAIKRAGRLPPAH